MKALNLLENSGDRTSGARLAAINEAWQQVLQDKISINIERGIPSLAQLALSQPLLNEPLSGEYIDADGTDSRNYGQQQGLPVIRALFSPFMGVPADQIVAHGSSSLALMYDTVSWAVRHGVPGDHLPWSEVKDATFICIVPGYDRHFAICEEFGLKMMAVPMLEDGPDMVTVENICRQYPNVKGIWCVPKYSNPTGTVYSDKVIDALASMKTAASDFRIFWDNAYCAHPLADSDRTIASIYEACVRHGNPDRVFIYASTSKMTLPGAGVAFMGASCTNTTWWLRHAAVRSVGPDKINQLRQVRFLKSPENIRALMAQHRQLLRPKFELIDDIFSEVLGCQQHVSWTRPEGGYFVSLHVLPGTASRIVQLAAEAGVRFARPGSCYPYGCDDRDAQLRIAPSWPEKEPLSLALTVIAVCIAKATAEKLL